MSHVENQPEASPEDDGWISAEERLPEEHDSLFAKYYGTPGWRSGMFRNVPPGCTALCEPVQLPGYGGHKTILYYEP